MHATTRTRSSAVRERLAHPVIDGDGHILEILPVLKDYIRDIGGPKVLARYEAGLGCSNNHDGDMQRVGGPRGWFGLSREERLDMRVSRPGFWGFQTGNALDRATVMLPNLFRQRMDELGIDFAILYATAALHFPRNSDEELRRVCCRAFNTMAAELYAPHADRLTVAAEIPLYTPEEALEELEFAVKKLGMKAVVLGTCVRRPIPDAARRAPEVAGYATWIDPIALGSVHDYDPVWQRCVDLKVAVTSHSHGMGWGARNSPENYIYNHIGHFAAAGEAFCKALVMGGVVRRFPTLRFAFLEGGVGWACALYNDLIEHWEKRNIEALTRNLDPSKLDRAAVEELFEKYGGKLAARKSEAIPTHLAPKDTADLDEWSALQIDDPHRFKEIFKNFFFGCESDDRMTAVAFNAKVNHFGAKLGAFFSSDIGHFDVPDITKVVAEAYELVEDGLLSEEDFRDFAFANSVRLHGGMNPEFFKGTVVEDAARRTIEEESA